jgi:hypothetical protein
MTTRLKDRVANRRIEEPKRLLAKRLARKDKTLSERWYAGVVGNSISAEIAPQKGAESTSSKRGAPAKQFSQMLASAMEQPIAANTIYEMPPHEAQKFRQQLYAINAKGKYHWYSRYLDQKYLMIWRMK